MTRRTFIKLLGAASATAYVGAVAVRLVRPCELCEAGFPHFPPSKGFACRWLEVNKRFPCPPEWRMG